MILKNTRITEPKLLAEWREKAGEHPYSIGALNFPRDWGWEDNATHTDIIRWVVHLGPMYVYYKESNLLMVYYI